MPQRELHNEEILQLIHDEKWTSVAKEFANCHPADIADIIDSAPRDEWDHLFSLLSDNVKSEVLTELEPRAESEVLDSLSNAEISKLVEEMAPDDAADVLADLPKDRIAVVLSLLPREESKDLRQLMSFDEDSAGGIMTTEVVSMLKDQTVEEAIKAIAYIETTEPFVYAYIVDDNDQLTGYVGIWELLREKDHKKPLLTLCHTDYVAVNVNDDQEDVARIMSQYDINIIPVVDNANKLIGRVTADDVIDVIQEEASEDIFRLAGSDDSELESNSTIKSCIVRLPWLLVTLFGGCITSIILQRFHAHIHNIIILGAFVPILLAMGGSTGIQSSTLVVRTIAVRGIEGRSIFRLLIREIMIGALMGCICGLIIGGWADFMASRDASFFTMFPAWQLSIAVGAALFAGMTFAALFGAFVPIVLNRIGIDPAVASGPFITITNDVAALLIYFGVTYTIFEWLA